MRQDMDDVHFQVENIQGDINEIKDMLKQVLKPS